MLSISRATRARDSPVVRCRYACKSPCSALRAVQYANRRIVRSTCAYVSARGSALLRANRLWQSSAEVPA